MSRSPLFLLDTNTFTYIVNGRTRIARETLKGALKYARVAVSTLTEAEILFGVENKPQAVRLRAAVHSLFESVQVLPWDSAAALAHGKLRFRMAAAGKSLPAIDMLIAAHAAASDAALVSHDKAFQQVTPFLDVIDWATDL